MEGLAWVTSQPSPHLGMPVGAVVVEDNVDRLFLGNVPFDLVQDPDKLLVRVALHVLASLSDASHRRPAMDDRSVQRVERGKKFRCALAPLVMGHHD